MDYIQDHWAGRMPLWKSYWVNAVLLSMVAGGILGGAAGFILALSGTEVPMEAWDVLSGWVALPITVWGMVGTWRSAVAYQAARPGRFWGIVAQVVIVLGALGQALRMSGLY